MLRGSGRRDALRRGDLLGVSCGPDRLLDWLEFRSGVCCRRGIDLGDPLLPLDGDSGEVLTKSTSSSEDEEEGRSVWGSCCFLGNLKSRCFVGDFVI